MNTYEVERRYWEEFYKNYFGYSIQFDAGIIPVKPQYPCGLALFCPELSKTIAVKKCSELFTTRIVFNNLSKDIPRNARTAHNGPYAIWFENALEPSYAVGQPVLTSDPHKKIGTTFLEEVLIHLEYFIRTGQHLNTTGMTLCSGSRFADGGVPGLRFNSEGFNLCWIALAQKHSMDGIRRVAA